MSTLMCTIIPIFQDSNIPFTTIRLGILNYLILSPGMYILKFPLTWSMPSMYSIPS